MDFSPLHGAFNQKLFEACCSRQAAVQSVCQSLPDKLTGQPRSSERARQESSRGLLPAKAGHQQAAERMPIRTDAFIQIRAFRLAKSAKTTCEVSLSLLNKRFL